MASYTNTYFVDKDNLFSRTMTFRIQPNDRFSWLIIELDLTIENGFMTIDFPKGFISKWFRWTKDVKLQEQLPIKMKIEDFTKPIVLDLTDKYECGNLCIAPLLKDREIYHTVTNKNLDLNSSYPKRVIDGSIPELNIKYEIMATNPLSPTFEIHVDRLDKSLNTIFHRVFNMDEYNKYKYFNFDDWDQDYWLRFPVITRSLYANKVHHEITICVNYQLDMRGKDL